MPLKWTISHLYPGYHMVRKSQNVLDPSHAFVLRNLLDNTVFKNMKGMSD